MAGRSLRGAKPKAQFIRPRVVEHAVQDQEVDHHLAVAGLLSEDESPLVQRKRSKRVQQALGTAEVESPDGRAAKRAKETVKALTPPPPWPPRRDGRSRSAAGQRGARPTQSQSSTGTPPTVAGGRGGAGAKRAGRGAGRGGGKAK
jgi:hypothetical protein